MKRNRIIQIIGLIGILSSFYACSPTFTSSISSSRSEQIPVSEILVLGINNTMDSTVFKIGEAEFKSTELGIDCEYDDAIAKLKENASKNGGNIIKITEQKNVSSILESCVTLKADIYYLANTDALKATAEKENKEYAEAAKSSIETVETSESSSSEKVDLPSSIPEGADYAMLYLYRTSDIFGFAITYSVHVDEEKIFKAKLGSGSAVKITTEGIHEVWAETEAKVSLPVDIQFGQEYYVRCSVGMGAFVGRPAFKLMDDKVRGKEEYTKAVK